MNVVDHGFIGRSCVGDLLRSMDIGVIPNCPPYGSQMKLLDYAAAGCLVLAPDVPHLVNFYSDQGVCFFEAGDRKRVLVLSPHPDDELIGCGGALLELQKQGAEIHIVQMTEGVGCKAFSCEPESIQRSIRWNEAQRVADQLGFKVHFLSTGESGALQVDDSTTQRVLDIFLRLRTSLVFVPALSDLHLEHRLTHEIFLNVSARLDWNVQAWAYPVWGFLPEPDVAMEVTSVYGDVLDSLYYYDTAMKAEDYVSRCDVLTAMYGKCYFGDASKRVEYFSILLCV